MLGVRDEWMKKIFLAVLTVFTVLFYVSVPGSSADVYYHKNENGKKIYTNIKPYDRGYEEYYRSPGTSRKSKPEKTESAPVISGSNYSENYDDLINIYADKHGLDPLLVKAIIKVESNFNPNAVSPKGATGLMQLMPGTAKMLGVKNSYNVNQNISGGTSYFRKLMDMFDSDTKLALAGYNAGENAVIKYGYSIPPYRETQNYVKKVMHHYKHLSSTSPSKNEPRLQVKFAGREKEQQKDKSVSFSYRESLKETGRRFSKTENPAHAEDHPRPVKVEYHYSVQVASFQSFEEAFRMKEQLDNDNKDVFIERTTIPGQGEWFRVKVGQFSTKNNAMVFAERFKEINPDFKTAYVTN